MRCTRFAWTVLALKDQNWPSESWHRECSCWHRVCGASKKCLIPGFWAVPAGTALECGGSANAAHLQALCACAFASQKSAKFSLRENFIFTRAGTAFSRARAKRAPFFGHFRAQKKKKNRIEFIKILYFCARFAHSFFVQFCAAKLR